MNLKLTSVLILPLLLVPLLLQAQISPEAFIGHKVVEDRKLIDYHQIRAYFKELDEASDKVSVLTIGQTTLNEPMIMAVITSEANMANLDHYRQITKNTNGVEKQ